MTKQIFNSLIHVGWEIEYLDNKNEPHTAFINKASKDEALRWFENHVSYSVITGTNPATFEDN